MPSKPKSSSALAVQSAHHSEAFKDIPELFESSYEESLMVRTEALNTFKQLGPADLVHVTKTIPNSRQQVKEVSSYHWVLGADTSSTAAVAAYINSLTYSMNGGGISVGHSTTPTAANGANSVPGPINRIIDRFPQLLRNNWSISRSTYCTWNAFTGHDLRVEARIPGGVKSYCINAIATKSATNSDAWQEVFLSSILRLIYHNNNSSYDATTALRKFNEMLNLQVEMRFLEAAAKLFWHGWQLGTPEGPQIAANHNNYLTLGVVTYFTQSQRPEIAAGFLKPFAEKDANLRGLVAQCCLLADQQGNAIKIMGEEMKLKPTASTLAAAANFLIDRRDLHAAKVLAEEAVKLEPGNFAHWARLFRVLVDENEIAKAIKILNNSPMGAWPAADVCLKEKMPKPAAVHHPKAHHKLPKKTASAQNHSSTSNSGASASSPALSVLEKLKASHLRGTYAQAYELLVELCTKVGWNALLTARSQVFVMEEEYRQQVSGTETEEYSAADEKESLASQSCLQIPLPLSSVSRDSNFLASTSKKLCERWLDNLFLVLFEDLRVFGLYKEELEQLLTDGNAKNLNNNNCSSWRSAKEWLLLAKLSYRLKRVEEAKFAYQKCIFTVSDNQQDIIVDALQDLTQLLTKKGRVAQALTIAARLLSHQVHHFQSDFLHPSPVSSSLLQLVSQHGLKRLQHDFMALDGDHRVLMKLDEFLLFACEAKVHGFDF